MPLEPKKPIEELLEASAKARRAEFDTDLKMPNPMRARLHDEIVRRARSGEPETRSPWLRMWWPRLIVGAAAAALAIGGPLIWWRVQQPAGGSLRLATNQPAPAGATNQLEEQSLPERAGSSAVSAEPKSMDLAKTADKNLPALEKFAELAIARSGPAPMAEGQPAEEKDVARLRAAPPASAAFARSGKTEATNLRQQFSQSLARQAFRRNAKEKQAANILGTFEIEQNGAQIRVVDADGSTYTGKIESVSREKLKEDRVARKPATGAEQASNGFYFRAAGYNGSLRKSVVFEGTYTAIESPQQEARDAVGAKNQQSMPARIIGTAKIKGESPVTIDAISVPAK